MDTNLQIFADAATKWNARGTHGERTAQAGENAIDPPAPQARAICAARLHRSRLAIGTLDG